MISEDSSEGQAPANNYLSLMARFGNDSPYQWVVYLITILSWASFGLINSTLTCSSTALPLVSPKLNTSTTSAQTFLLSQGTST